MHRLSILPSVQSAIQRGMSAGTDQDTTSVFACGSMSLAHLGDRRLERPDSIEMAMRHPHDPQSSALNLARTGAFSLHASRP